MLPVLALVGLMLLTWGAAVWASFVDEEHDRDSQSGQRHFPKAA
jgi:hypothetical protein